MKRYQSESEEYFAYLNRWRRVRRNFWIALGLTLLVGPVLATLAIQLRRWLMHLGH